VKGVGCRVEGLGSGCRVWGVGFRGKGLGCGVQRSRFRIQGENLVGELLERPEGHGNVHVVEDVDVQPVPRRARI